MSYLELGAPSEAGAIQQVKVLPKSTLVYIAFAQGNHKAIGSKSCALCGGAGSDNIVSV